MSKQDTAKVSVRVYLTREERKQLKHKAIQENKSLTKYIYDIIIAKESKK